MLSGLPHTVAPRLDRIVAVGDIHADLDALLRILAGARLIDPDGRWIGQDCRLVLLGDLIDRGSDSVAVMSCVMDLESQAADHGCRVDALLGNHEMLAAQGEYQYVQATEALALHGLHLGGLCGLDAVFRGDGPWARWTRQRPALLQVGSTVFVHAGLDPRVLDLPIDAINDAVRAWVAHFQGAARAPERSTGWLVDFDGQGPLWTRNLMVSRMPPWHAARTRAGLQQVLSRLGARRLVVGHSPTAALDFEIAWPHPVFGDAVAVIDTGISRCYGGRLSALEIAGDAVRPLYFERADTELPLTGLLRDRYARALERMTQSA